MKKEYVLRGKRWKDKYTSALKGLYGTAIDLSQPNLSIPTASKKNLIESEKKAQERIVQWLIKEEIPVYSIPNGANVSIYHRQALVRGGLRPGVPDLCIPRARGGFHGLYIEMKREDGGGGLSEVQKKWLEILTKEGYYAVKCDGFDNTKQCILDYLLLPR